MSNFDKELENINISEEWIDGELLGEPLSNYPEAIEAIKQAFDDYIIGEAEVPKYGAQDTANYRNWLRGKQRKALWEDK